MINFQLGLIVYVGKLKCGKGGDVALQALARRGRSRVMKHVAYGDLDI